MNTLAHLLWQLGRRPELQHALRAQPELVQAAVEETLRLWSPVDHGTRVTTKDVEIGGIHIPAAPASCCAPVRPTATRECSTIPTPSGSTAADSST